MAAAEREDAVHAVRLQGFGDAVTAVAGGGSGVCHGVVLQAQ